MRPISDEHTELFHYTTAAGLSGIVTSGTLWVVHSAFLNDYQEYRLFFDQRLPALLESAISAAYEQRQTHPHVTFEVRRLRGASAYRNSVLQNMLPALQHYTRELNTPYVACFCSAASQLVATHGLLSQWRGYGSDGGYALVFDTKKLDHLMQEEAKQIKGMDFFIGDAEYYDNIATDPGTHEETRELMKEVTEALTEFLTSNSQDDLARIFTPIHRLACTAKHWGFREESEVRIVLSQPHESLVKALPREHELKTVRHFLRRGTAVPYMALLDSLGRSAKGRLPIRRVIVGPHPESASRKLAAELLLRQHGYETEVHVSGIPFRGS
jgi:hypothetical protein